MSDRMVLLAIYGNPIEAELVRAELEAEGMSNVQLLVPEGDYERASELLAEETDVGREAREDRERDEEAEGATAIREPTAARDDATEIRAAAESPVRDGPAVPPHPGPAEGGEAPADAADEFPADDEREERSVLWTADDVAARAFRAALFGFLICPGLLHLYALWLLIRLPATEGDLSPAGSRKAVAAFVLAILPGVFCVLLVLGLFGACLAGLFR